MREPFDLMKAWTKQLSSLMNCPGSMGLQDDSHFASLGNRGIESRSHDDMQ